MLRPDEHGLGGRLRPVCLQFQMRNLAKVFCTNFTERTPNTSSGGLTWHGAANGSGSNQRTALQEGRTRRDCLRDSSDLVFCAKNFPGKDTRMQSPNAEKVFGGKCSRRWSANQSEQARLVRRKQLESFGLKTEIYSPRDSATFRRNTIHRTVQ